LFSANNFICSKNSKQGASPFQTTGFIIPLWGSAP